MSAKNYEEDQLSYVEFISEPKVELFWVTVCSYSYGDEVKDLDRLLPSLPFPSPQYTATATVP